ncbi:MAG: hypothetical protein U9N07_06735 [Euryarchaeota archaeon]|nr:hypothetical protein [Euryarchaeota archaeon]
MINTVSVRLIDGERKGMAYSILVQQSQSPYRFFIASPAADEIVCFPVSINAYLDSIILLEGMDVFWYQYSIGAHCYMTIQLSYDPGCFYEIWMQQRFSTAENKLTLRQWERGFKEILTDELKHIQRHDSAALVQITVFAVQLAEIYDVKVKEVCWHD